MEVYLPFQTAGPGRVGLVRVMRMSGGRPQKIVTGGQSGVDRAALEVALRLGIPCGGWCPAGRRAEDGPIPGHFPLRETPSADYEQRTEWNIRDSDGTLVLNRGELEGGTLYTAQIAERSGRPLRVVDLDRLADPAEFRAVVAGIRHWLEENKVGVLNVAGPRESKSPGIGEAAAVFLETLLGE
jgi:hypothetical protein